jgi:RNA polymerase-binding transcription factor DksA
MEEKKQLTIKYIAKQLEKMKFGDCASCHKSIPMEAGYSGILSGIPLCDECYALAIIWHKK